MISDIVCFFAAKGFWPFYPPMLQYQVNEMGKKIFALSDDRVRQFCRGKFNFQETCYRPGKIRFLTPFVCLVCEFWFQIRFEKVFVFLILC